MKKMKIINVNRPCIGKEVCRMWQNTSISELILALHIIMSNVPGEKSQKYWSTLIILILQTIFFSYAYIMWNTLKCLNGWPSFNSSFFSSDETSCLNLAAFSVRNLSKCSFYRSLTCSYLIICHTLIRLVYVLECLMKYSIISCKKRFVKDIA